MLIDDPKGKRPSNKAAAEEILQVVRQAEEVRTRRAYREQPDSEAEADDWSTAEAWKD